MEDQQGGGGQDGASSFIEDRADLEWGMQEDPANEESFAR